MTGVLLILRTRSLNISRAFLHAEAGTNQIDQIGYFCVCEGGGVDTSIKALKGSRVCARSSSRSSSIVLPSVTPRGSIASSPLFDPPPPSYAPFCVILNDAVHSGYCCAYPGRVL